MPGPRVLLRSAVVDATFIADEAGVEPSTNKQHGIG